MFELFPAIDIVEGQAVRLQQGESGSETSYGKPLDAAKNWLDQGARWLHIVDLDAAFGRGNNAAVIEQIASQIQINCEVSGGLRDDESLRRAMEAGAARVNLGTAAIEKPEWTRDAIAEYRDKIAVGLDVRGTTLASRGWVEEAGDLWATLARLDQVGCARYVVTDVTRDGMLTGPNVELLKQVAEKTPAKVVASGGIARLDDLKVLREAGCVEGAIIGKALYSGAFTLREAFETISQ